MSERKYTLELTADELVKLSKCYPHDYIVGLGFKLSQLRAQADEDREADDIGLPWYTNESRTDLGWWKLYRTGTAGPVGPSGVMSERAAKLMSAAPELLEAVEAWKAWDETGFDDLNAERLAAARAAVARALRKVATGVPE